MARAAGGENSRRERQFWSGSRNWTEDSLAEEKRTKEGEQPRLVGLEWKATIVNDAGIWRYFDKLLRAKLTLKELEVVKQWAMDPTFEEERERLEDLRDKYRECAGEGDN